MLCRWTWRSLLQPWLSKYGCMEVTHKSSIITGRLARTLGRNDKRSPKNQGGAITEYQSYGALCRRVQFQTLLSPDSLNECVDFQHHEDDHNDHGKNDHGAQDCLSAWA